MAAVNFPLSLHTKHHAGVKLALASTLVFLLSGLFNVAPATAKTRRFAFELPTYDQAAHSDLVQRVEPFATQEIDRQFRRDPNLTTIELIITMNRNGDVMPLLTTIVTRAQWQASPQIGQWTKYHRSYARFQRPKLQPRRTIIATTRRNTTNWKGGASRVEISLDRGKLNRRLAQQQLSSLD